MSRSQLVSIVLALGALGLAFWAMFVPLSSRHSAVRDPGPDRGRAVALRDEGAAVRLAGRPERGPAAPVQAEVDSGRVAAKQGVIDVRVVTGAREPIAGADVFGAAREGDLVPREHAVTTDEGGRCLLTVRQGTRSVCAVARGFIPACVPVSQSDASCTIVLDEGLGIRGSVVDESGREVVGATVVGTTRMAWGAPPGTRDWLVAGAPGFSVVADEEGRFAATGLLEGERYIVYAIAEGYAPRDASRVVHTQAGADDVLVRMTANARVELRFVDGTTGEHLTDVGVGSFDNDSTKTLTWGWGSGAPVTAEESETLWRNEHTVFLLAPQSPESWDAEQALPLQVHVERIGYEPRLVQVEAKLGETKALEVALARSVASDWVRLKPRAEFTSGIPFDGDLQVNVRGRTGQLERLLTFRGGVAVQDLPLPPGAYRLSAQGARGIGSLWSPASAGEEWIADTASPAPVLRLSGNPIRLRVVDPHGRRVRAYHVARVPSDGMPVGSPVWNLESLRGETSSDAPDPAFCVPPGPCEIHVRTEDGLTGVVRYSGTGDGSPVELTVQLTK